MKKLFILLFTLFVVNGLNAQSCLPEGIEFTTQAQIDSFQMNYPGCTEIEGDVEINGDDITNLNELIVLTSIEGYLNIEGNDSLISLDGLENITTVGDYLQIGGASYYLGNRMLSNISGLENLASLGGGLFIERNIALTSLTGLENLTSIDRGTLIISGNNALTSLTGLENLTSISGWLMINSNWTLLNLTGLEKLNSVGGTLLIDGNHLLINLMGLENLTTVEGYLNLSLNLSLTSLSGLDNIEAGTITGISIYGNLVLSTCHIKSICDYLSTQNDSIDIHNNATGCNTKEQVEESCALFSMNENITNHKFQIYPNPSSTQITIELPYTLQKNTSLTISNTNAQQLIAQPIIKQQTEIDISSLPTGIYIVKVWNDKGVMVQKVIKQ